MTRRATTSRGRGSCSDRSTLHHSPLPDPDHACRCPSPCPPAGRRRRHRRPGRRVGGRRPGDRRRVRTRVRTQHGVLAAALLDRELRLVAAGPEHAHADIGERRVPLRAAGGRLVALPGSRLVRRVRRLGHGVGRRHAAVHRLPRLNGLSTGYVELALTATPAYTNGSFTFSANLASGGTIGGAVSTVPEPTTVALLGGGLALVGLVARRRRHA
jgi:hypothetical protein